MNDDSWLADWFGLDTPTNRAPRSPYEPPAPDETPPWNRQARGADGRFMWNRRRRDLGGRFFPGKPD